MSLSPHQRLYLTEIVDLIEDINEFIKTMNDFQLEKDEKKRVLLEKDLNEKSKNVRINIQLLLKNTPWERFFELHNDLLNIEGAKIFFKIWVIFKESIQEFICELEKNESIKNYLEEKRKRS